MSRKRRDIDYFVILIMLVILAYLGFSGIVMDVYGSEEFYLHSEAGYAILFFAALHIVFNWQKTRTYLLAWKFFNRSGSERLPATPPAKIRESTAAPRADNSHPHRGKERLGRRTLLVSSMSGMTGFVLGRYSVAEPPACLDEEIEIGGRLPLWKRLFGGTAYANTEAKLIGKRDRYKTYPKSKRTKLGDPPSPKVGSFWNLVEERRSAREYGTSPMPKEILSRILATACGITDNSREYRAAPSGGALYPLEIYAVVHAVKDVPKGVYHYFVRDHEIELVREGAQELAIIEAGVGQDFLGKCQVTFVISAIFERSRKKYRKQAYRYTLIEAGHVGQNILLSATALGLSSCAVGAFRPEKLNGLLGIDGKTEMAVYIMTVGAAKG